MEDKLSMGQQFLAKIDKIISENLGNEEFSVEDLARLVGLSRSMLHRKLKKLVGKSASDLITEKRLAKAKVLLEGDVATASEIAYEVGFNSPSYFTKVFKKYYHLSPGAIRKNETEGSSPIIEDTDSDDSVSGPANKRVGRSKIFLVALLGIVALVTAYFIFSPAQPFRKSLAVLPLHNLTGQAENNYFVDGMHESLIGELGKISSLRVISRTSTLRYRESDKLLKDIARELGVNTIVEGSVIGAGDSIRIIIQLIDVFPKENHLLANEYRDNMHNILTVQSTAVKDIAQKIHIKLSRNDEVRLSQPREVDPEVYKIYLKGRFYWDKLTEKDLDSAMYCFELARQKDPNYALAYSGISLVWLGRLQQGLVPYAEGLSKMKVAVTKTLELDSTLSDVQYMLGGVNCWGEWRYSDAEKAYRTAIALNPNNPAPRAYLSHVLNILHKDQDEAMEQIETAITLDPLNPLYTALYGMDLIYAHQYDQAIEVLKKNLMLAPGHGLTLSTLRTAYHLKGMQNEALQMWVNSYETKGDQVAVDALMEGNKKGGYPGALENLAKTLIARSDTEYVTPWQIGTLYTRAGMKSDAIDWLEKAYYAHDQNMPYILVDPIFDILKDESRFRNLLNKMKSPA